MHLKFFKYQGTGNDFIMLDGLDESLPELSQSQVERLCHRRFGIGADGLIILARSADYDFEMLYYNSDGRQSSMCGNGGRCITRFAYDQGLRKTEYHFLAIDGPHKSRVTEDHVSLQMKDVEFIENLGQDKVFLDTGSPHYVSFANDLEDENFVTKARHVRYSEKFKKHGVNVNFVKSEAGILQMRTYERGVEDETYSCGTGVTASALAAHHRGILSSHEVAVFTRGGNLRVTYEPGNNTYRNIWLHGPVEKVFEGRIDL